MPAAYQCSIPLISLILSVFGVLYCGYHLYLPQAYCCLLLQQKCCRFSQYFWRTQPVLVVLWSTVLRLLRGAFAVTLLLRVLAIVQNFLKVCSTHTLSELSILRASVQSRRMYYSCVTAVVRVCVPGTTQWLLLRQHGSACFTPPRKHPSHEYICTTVILLSDYCAACNGTQYSRYSSGFQHSHFRDSYIFPA